MSRELLIKALEASRSYGLEPRVESGILYQYDRLEKANPPPAASTDGAVHVAYARWADRDDHDLEPHKAFIAGVEFARSVDAPIDMVLHCPKCHMQHIDLPEHWGGKVVAHRSHRCVPAAGGCGYIWRPADVPTNGVAAVKTVGRHDSPLDVATPAPDSV